MVAACGTCVIWYLFLLLCIVRTRGYTTSIWNPYFHDMDEVTTRPQRVNATVIRPLAAFTDTHNLTLVSTASTEPYKSISRHGVSAETMNKNVSRKRLTTLPSVMEKRRGRPKQFNGFKQEKAGSVKIGRIGKKEAKSQEKVDANASGTKSNHKDVRDSNAYSLKNDFLDIANTFLNSKTEIVGATLRNEEKNELLAIFERLYSSAMDRAMRNVPDDVSRRTNDVHTSDIPPTSSPLRHRVERSTHMDLPSTSRSVGDRLGQRTHLASPSTHRSVKQRVEQHPHLGLPSSVKPVRGRVGPSTQIDIPPTARPHRVVEPTVTFHPQAVTMYAEFRNIAALAKASVVYDYSDPDTDEIVTIYAEQRGRTPNYQVIVKDPEDYHIPPGPGQVNVPRTPPTGRHSPTQEFENPDEPVNSYDYYFPSRNGSTTVRVQSEGPTQKYDYEYH